MYYYYLIGLVIAGGAFTVLQAAMNAELRVALGNGVVASTVNFGIGFLFLLIVCLAARLLPVSHSAVVSTPWWAWVGGIVGALFVASLSIATRDLGAVLTFALILVGQFSLSLIFDHFGLLGYQQQSLTSGKVLGLLMLVVGVVLIRRG